MRFLFRGLYSRLRRLRCLYLTRAVRRRHLTVEDRTQSSVHVGFVVDRVALVQGFLQGLLSIAVAVNTPVLYSHI